MERRRGRVRAGVTGYHPTLQTTICPGEEYDVPVQDWSDTLFETVDSSPLSVGESTPKAETEQPFSRRTRSSLSEQKKED